MQAARLVSLRRGVGALALAALMVTGTTQQAQAAPHGVPQQTQPVMADLVASSGTDWLVMLGAEYWLYHGDSRKTWVSSKLAFTDDYVRFAGMAGSVLYYVDDATGKLASYNLASNTVTTTSLDADGLSNVADNHMLVDNDDGKVIVKPLSGSEAPWTVAFAEPTWADYTDYQLAADGVVLAAVGDDNEKSELTLIKRGGATTVAVPRSELMDRVLADGVLWYAARNASTANVCRLDVATLARSCKDLALGTTSADLSLALHPAKGGLLVRTSWYGHQNRLNWFASSAGALATAKQVPVATPELDLADISDNSAPAAFATVSTTSSYLQSVAADGSLGAAVPVAPAGTELVQLGSLALTPTTLIGSDARRRTGWQSAQRTDTAWKRSVGSTLGAEAVLSTTMRGSAVASAGRWAMGTATGVRTFDRGVATQTAEQPGAELVQQSGPYLLTDESAVRSANGSWRVIEGLNDIFGGLGVIGAEGSVEGVADFRVRDLTGAGAADIVFSLKAHDVSTEALIWGDWVAAEYNRANGEDDWEPGTIAYNYRTKAMLKLIGAPVDLGDGVVITKDSDNAFSAVVLRSGVTRKLTTGEQLVSIDGSRVAYSAAGKVIVDSIAGAGTSAPRSLGVVAPVSFSGTVWTPQIDLTKPLAAGTLQIKDTAGRVVRSLRVPASTDGSIRGVSWNALDAKGKKVPKGSYTYWLTNQAVDGSGPVVRVDGKAGALGKLSVTFITAATPKIVGTPKVGKTLKVTTGTWKPAPTFSYQWYRSGKAISGAIGAAYKLVKADKGKTVTVKVTGAKSGYVTTSKNSAATKRIK